MRASIHLYRKATWSRAITAMLRIYAILVTGKNGVEFGEKGTVLRAEELH